MSIKSYERRFVAAIQSRSCKGACQCHTLDFLDFISIPKNLDDCFNFVESMSSESESLERWKMNWAWKKNSFSRSNYNWVSGGFGDDYREVMASVSTRDPAAAAAPTVALPSAGRRAGGPTDWLPSRTVQVLPWPARRACQWRMLSAALAATIWNLALYDIIYNIRR